MPFAINSNPGATTASLNLSRASDLLQKSLEHLSTGKRINSSGDDASGLAISYKLHAQGKRTNASIQNAQNATSLLQDQDAKLGMIGKILDRVSELRTLSDDVTKNSGDLENYSMEFQELQRHLQNIGDSQFNGIDLFSYNDTDTSSILKSTTTNYTDSDGAVVNYSKFGLMLDIDDDSGGKMSINVTNLQFILMPMGNPVDNGFIPKLSTLSVDQIVESIGRVAHFRAENGAEQNIISRRIALQQTNSSNLEAAYGRIVDADIASESSRFARHNILVQASAAMNTQANQLTSVGLQLIN